MKKLLLFVAAALMAVSAFSDDLYLRGSVTGWDAKEEFKFTTTDNVNFVLEKDFVLTGDFKFADAGWSFLNYGMADEEATLGTTFAISDSGDNFSVPAGKAWNVTKIIVNIDQQECTIKGSEVSDEFDVNKDYGILFGQYFADDTKNTRDAMLFEGNGKYSVTVVLAEQEYGCKFADVSYSTINYGTNGNNIDITKPYNPAKGGANLWFDTEAAMPEWGSLYKIELTIDKNWNATCSFTRTSAAYDAKAESNGAVKLYKEGKGVVIVLGDGSEINLNSQKVR